MKGITAEKDYLIHISKAIITLFRLSCGELGTGQSTVQSFPTRAQEQGKPLSPITEKVARPDPSSVSAGRVRENSSETVLSKEGKSQKFTQ